jgi:hypothetical protein
VVGPARSGSVPRVLDAGPLLAGCPDESMFNVEHEPECRATSRTHLPHDGGHHATQSLLAAHGFSGAIISGMVNRSLVTLSFEKFQAGGKMIKVRMERITTAGRDALAVDN